MDELAQKMDLLDQSKAKGMMVGRALDGSFVIVPRSKRKPHMGALSLEEALVRMNKSYKYVVSAPLGGYYVSIRKPRWKIEGVIVKKWCKENV